MMVLAVGIWTHLKPGEFSMIHGTQAEHEGGGKCAHATEKAAHLAHYKPNWEPSRGPERPGLEVSAPPANVGGDMVDAGAMIVGE